VDRRTRIRLSLLVAIVAVTVGITVFLAQSRIPGGTSQESGVIVAVDAAGLGDVRGFTLRVAGGALLEFSLRALENGAEFPPGHLVEHQATAAPVRVVYRMDGNERLAIQIEDAPR
jgi:hypothetical protein